MTAVLQGRCAIVTGASMGLGREIARQYARAGASLLLCARDSQALRGVKDELRDAVQAGQAVETLAGDVSDPSFTLALAERAVSAFGHIDILVNNAGIYGPKGAVEEVDWLEWMRTVQINLFGSVLMCRAVLPHMKARRRGKIVQLSGGGATAPMPLLSAYAASKAAAVRFIDSLAQEVREFGIDVNAIAPGALNTRMLDEVIEAGPQRVGQTFYERALQQRESGGAGLERGAALAVFLGSAESDGISGKLVSAVWDRWEDWPAHLAELQASDAYTLRRIAGRDRGHAWGDR